VDGFSTVTRVAPAPILTQLGVGPAYAGYVQRTSETPAPAETPAALALPEADVGINLAYAFQWYVFIGVALVGWFILLRRDTRDAEAGTRITPAPGREPAVLS
jgi:cytochrome oxidase assembly protein ShyY1